MHSGEKKLKTFLSLKNIIRPANFPDGCIGHGYGIYDFGKFRLAVINLMGTVYMDALDNPFSVMDRILNQIDTPNIIVDFHAEATAEKRAWDTTLQDV